jgi:hypothetical protein
VASTLAKVRNAVRFRIRDVASAHRAFNTMELNEIIQANLRTVAGDIPLGEKWVLAANGITVTAGSDTASLPSGVEYDTVLALRRTADGQALTKRTREEMEKMFWQSGTATTNGSAEPTDFCLIEDETQTVGVRFQSAAATTTTLDLCRRVMPTDLTADSGAVPFATLAIEALIDLSAMEALAKMTDAVLAERNLNPQVGTIWAARAAKNIKNETERLHKQRGVGRPMRFVP